MEIWGFWELFRFFVISFVVAKKVLLTSIIKMWVLELSCLK